MISILFTFLIVIVASFLCAMAEAAILSLPLIRARMLVEEKKSNAKDVLYLKEHIAISLAVIVIINNSIQIIGSIFVGEQSTRIFGEQWLGAASALITFCIIVFGEIIPKAIGERYKVGISLFFAKPLRLLVWVFAPFVNAVMLFARPWTKGNQYARVTEEEIKMMLKLGKDSGTVESDEEILINGVFRLNDLRAMNIMKNFNEVYMLPGEKTLTEAKDLIIMSPYNRIAVFQGEKLNIIGIVQHRILLREIAKGNGESKIQDWMLKPIFVNQMMKADALMEKFQDFHQHLFIVQDNVGKNVGLVTMEDVLEELFGEIYDEKDIRFKMMARQIPKSN